MATIPLVERELSAKELSVRPVVWTIAGSDSGGGAGIQADLLTLHDLGCHGCSVITALTAQNSVAVTAVEPVSAAMLNAQLEALKADLYPSAVKIGLIGNQQQLEFLADWLGDNLPGVPVILDPVMVASCGDGLQSREEAPETDDVKGKPCLDFSPFVGKISLITPNKAELARLTGELLADDDALVIAADRLWQRFGGSVLAKGGDCPWQQPRAKDLLLLGDIPTISPLHRRQGFWLSGERVATAHNHGSGCTLSSAIAAFVARGLVLPDAVLLAKAYVFEGLRQASAVGKGPGPLARTGIPESLTAMASIYPLHESRSHRLPTKGFTRLGRNLGVYPVVADIDMLEALLEAGAKTIQLRIKGEIGPGSPAEADIIRAIELGRQYQARVFINDHWRLAISYGAFGVHLGQEDVDTVPLDAIAEAGMALGLSSHGLFEALLALELHPSYLALGHIFPTTTKEMPSKPQGLETLALLTKIVSTAVPTVAIGGIEAGNLPKVAATGVDNIAVVRAVTEASDPAAAFRALADAWENRNAR
ncbi:thiamine phosphate synthase [Shewanella litorisediminis]|uniref:Thiamine-phosphate synthase n=1 Tax=Shewanella litorisediminis TaxID=1173586 RepID=A0ABX7FYM6_9GAMM|nr:thiamine phosphate synthase [Shewanella litorisediminis]MCL2919270.1 thiamine phosphate synthase [Shewanella litorisediminis]QRH00139.1 thiamine phosphate synthase [Shewanella litorisediminis]